MSILLTLVYIAISVMVAFFLAYCATFVILAIGEIVKYTWKRILK